MTPKVVSVYENTEKLGIELAKNLSELANDVLNKGGNTVFKIGLSGGSVVSLLSEYLAKVETDWSKWRFFFCDERLVPFDDAESTYAQYRNKFIGHLPVTEDQFIKINPQLSVNEAANDYIKKMSVYFAPYELPRFDALILGVGPDGHTCSLFPGHKLCDETSVWVAPISDSPKPPPNRITLTFPILNNARYCVFVATGSSKADIIKRILKDNEHLPANCVKPTNGSVQWLLDELAAKLLQDETSL
ncbi:6-phosphogluconolactonase isoform X1 [Daktulosphaira vitifoliae]|uniref:6-phosphogluconolactonase isoform X1 n=1 Tax=Daktulosphaira vitifoliae TaxID=58002 RepID=UPI0021A984A0|nr:6-phosphogluconolactonase isoform X1 [Daktulosphaira vitifoliae]